jgi:hypothetical protein
MATVVINCQCIEVALCVDDVVNVASHYAGRGIFRGYFRGLDAGGA